MVVLHDIRSQIEKTDQQILDLLEQRVSLWRSLAEEGEVEFPDREGESEAIAMWVEEAADRGLDEIAVERVCRTVLGLCRRAGP
jgi:chorismate mutase